MRLAAELNRAMSQYEIPQRIARTVALPPAAERLDAGAALAAGLFAGAVLLGMLIGFSSVLYGEEPWPEVDSTNRARDDFELALLNEALDRDIPVLAICRGHQLINVAMGGTLFSDIEIEAEGADRHNWMEKKDQVVHPTQSGLLARFRIHQDQSTLNEAGEKMTIAMSVVLPKLKK